MKTTKAAFDPAPVKECVCQHAYQDAIYGAKRRVHTVHGMKTGKQTPSAECTVCGTRKSL